MKLLLISGKATHGKDELANALVNQMVLDGKTSLIIKYGDYVKFVSEKFYYWNGEKDIHGRTLLQLVGTEIGKAYDKNIWINKLLDDVNVFAENVDYILVPDVRFPEEIEVPKSKFSAISIRINRLSYESDLTEEQKHHISEIALDNYEFDFILNVNDGLDNLVNASKELYNHIK